MGNEPKTSTVDEETESAAAILEGIACGEHAFAEGRVISHDEAMARLKRRVKESDNSAQNINYRTGNG